MISGICRWVEVCGCRCLGGLILKTSIYPKFWEHALVQPIPKKLTILTPPTTDPLPSHQLLPNSLHFPEIHIFLSTLNPTPYSQIINMTSIRQDLLVMFSPISLTSDHPFCMISWNPLSSLLISLRRLTESVTWLCRPNSHH